MELLWKVMEQRHSVRQYLPKPIDADVLQNLTAEIASCNQKSGLRIQLVTNEPKAFSGLMAHYGKFSGVAHYLALVGAKSNDLDEKCGYFGQHLVLKAQQLGLNTCWVGMTYSKTPGAFTVEKGEKLTAVIALGYGQTQGIAHRSKSPEEVSNIHSNTPDWFKKGVEAALLAPTSMNQQKFYLTYMDGKVLAKVKPGFYAKLNLGIVKYHFQLGSGKDASIWA